MPVMLEPGCVKKPKRVLNSREHNRKFLTGDSLINVIIGIWTKYSGEQEDKSICSSQAGKLFKTMFDHTHTLQKSKGTK